MKSGRKPSSNTEPLNAKRKDSANTQFVIQNEGTDRIYKICIVLIIFCAFFPTEDIYVHPVDEV